MEAVALEGGFAEAATGSAAAFRAVLEAMARPGTLQRLTGAVPPAPLSVAAGTLLLTLCDPETPVFLAGGCDLPAVRDWLTFHTGAPFAGPGECAFAVGRWADLCPLERFSAGTPEYPDRSATLIVEGIDPAAVNATLRGPGIDGVARMALPEIAAFVANRRRFPLGLDFCLTAGDRVTALPRSTVVEAL